MSRQATQGNYVPSSTDLQLLMNYQFNPKWQAELFGNISKTKFSLNPEFSQLSTSVFSPFFTQSLGIDIYFDGQEKDEYSTSMIGVALTNQVSRKLKLKWLASRFENNEGEERGYFRRLFIWRKGF